MSVPTVGELFAGIGGFGLGFRRAGFGHAFMVERDVRCQEVLARRFPGVPLFDDVREVGGHNLPPCDVLAFGSPCQDLSIAGKRAGLEGARSGLIPAVRQRGRGAGGGVARAAGGAWRDGASDNLVVRGGVVSASYSGDSKPGSPAFASSAASSRKRTIWAFSERSSSRAMATSSACSERGRRRLITMVSAEVCIAPLGRKRGRS